MPFNATWHELLHQIDELSKGASMVTPLSHRQFRIANTQEQRVIISFDDEDGHRPLQRDQLIADRVADVTVTTPREAGKTVVNERGRIWGQLEHLEDDLDNAYARLEQEHNHEQQLDQAVANAQASDGRMTTVYKAAIAGLIIVVFILIGVLLL